MMRNDAAQADWKHGTRFVEAKRVAQVLRDFEQRLHLLARGGDGGQEVYGCVFGGARLRLCCLLETRGRREPIADLQVRRQFSRRDALALRHTLQFDVPAGKSLDDTRVECLARL